MGELRAATRRNKDGDQTRPLLPIALVLPGQLRAEAAQVRDMDGRMLRNWIICYDVLYCKRSSSGSKSRSRPSPSTWRRADEGGRRLGRLFLRNYAAGIAAMNIRRTPKPNCQ